MTALASRTRTANVNGHTVGRRAELARYSTPAGERLLYGQRIDGHVWLVDAPATGAGRSYVIERELEQDGYAALQAIVSDYLDQAARHQSIPAADSPIDRYLQNLE